jgi:WD40 repeat protein
MLFGKRDSILNLDKPEFRFSPFAYETEIWRMVPLYNNHLCLFSASSGETLIWNLALGEKSSVIAPKRETIRDFVPHAAFELKDGSTLCLVWDSYVAFYNMFTGKMIHHFKLGFWARKTDFNSFFSGCYCPTTGEIFTGHVSGDVYRWASASATKGEQIFRVGDTVRALCMGPEGVLLGGSQNGNFLRFDIGNETFQFIEFGGRADFVEYEPDNNMAIVGSAPNDINVFNIDTGSGNKVHLPSGQINSLLLSNTQLLFCAGNESGEVSIWDFIHNKRIADISTGSGKIRGLRFLEGAGKLLTAGTDVCVWDMGELIAGLDK